MIYDVLDELEAAGNYSKSFDSQIANARNAFASLRSAVVDLAVDNLAVAVSRLRGGMEALANGTTLATLVSTVYFITVCSRRTMVSN